MHFNMFNAMISAYRMSQNGGVANKGNINLPIKHSTIREIPYWIQVSGIPAAHLFWWRLPRVIYG